MKKLLASIAIAATAFGTISVVASPADATVKRTVAFNNAYSQKGHWYCYGHAGSKGCGHASATFDCSGLVYWAYKKAGITLPRPADKQRYSSKVTKITKAQAKTGDLVFWGTGHVEFVYRTASGTVKRYGAHHSGTKLSVESMYGSPTYVHVKTAG